MCAHAKFYKETKENEAFVSHDARQTFIYDRLLKHLCLRFSVKNVFTRLLVDRYICIQVH